MIQNLIDRVNDRFTDLPIFNAANFSSRHCYFEEEDERDFETKRWLLRLCEKFDVQNSPIIEIEKKVKVKCNVLLSLYIEHIERKTCLEHGRNAKVNQNGVILLQI